MLATFDIYVFPSLWEGFPYSIVEALRSACVIVATRVGGIPEAVTDGVEATVAPGSKDEIIKAVEKLMADREMGQVLARNARAKFERELTLPIMHMRVRQVFWVKGEGGVMALNAAILGAGFISQNFMRLALTGDSLRVLDHKVCPKEFEGRLIWIKGDSSDQNALRNVLQHAEVVYHFISSTVPGDTADEGGELIQNVVQTLRLLKLCVQEKCAESFLCHRHRFMAFKPVADSRTALTDPISFMEYTNLLSKNISSFTNINMAWNADHAPEQSIWAG